MKYKTLFSGIQPSGVLHIGNYLGAIKRWIELQNQYQSFFCIVDEHAITVPQDPKELRENTLRTAMMYLACGIDQKKSTIFVQSHVPAHAELGWILNTMTPLGELERMTQYKEKSQKPKVKSQKYGVLAGLLNYPTLMAADILLYQTNVVPVGDDQKQHVELTRSIAERFNNRYGKTFTIPKALINESGARIMGLDDPSKKMSKSAPNKNNYISLFDTPDEIRRKIKIAVTDSGAEITYDQEKKPAISNLLAIHHLISGKKITDLEKQYRGKGYAEFKTDLAEAVIQHLTPIQNHFSKLEKDRKGVLTILKNGAAVAQKNAGKTLAAVKEKIGLLL